MLPSFHPEISNEEQLHNDGIKCSTFHQCEHSIPCYKKRELDDSFSFVTKISEFILQADKFLKCDGLRPVVFKPNLKNLHKKRTPVT